MLVCCRYWIIPDITQAIFKEVIFDILEPCRFFKINECINALDNSSFGELPQDILFQYLMPRPSALILMGNLPKSDKTAIVLVYLLVPNKIRHIFPIDVIVSYVFFQ